MEEERKVEVEAEQGAQAASAHRIEWMDGLGAPAPESRLQANRLIEHIGSGRRELAQLELEMNQQIAEAKRHYEAMANGPREAVAHCESLLRQWCEEHRDELTEGGARKTAEFPAGKVAWRHAPPHVILPKRREGIEKLLDWLKARRLVRFIREIEEIDKPAMLAEPETVNELGFPGLRVRRGGERFEVRPVGLELAEGAEAQ